MWGCGNVARDVQSSPVQSSPVQSLCLLGCVPSAQGNMGAKSYVDDSFYTLFHENLLYI